MNNSRIWRHLDHIRAHYDGVTGVMAGAASYRQILAHYYSLYIPKHASVLDVGCGDGTLLSKIKNRVKVGLDVSEKQVIRARQNAPDATFHTQAVEELALPGETFDYIIASDTLNYCADVQLGLERLKTVSTPDTRLVLNVHSALWRPVLAMAEKIGLRAKAPQSNWLGRQDVASILSLAGWEVIKFQPRILLPVRFFGLEKYINTFIAPLVPFLCLSLFCIARRRPENVNRNLSVSVVIPARNEGGNIEAAIERTPVMGCGTEIIFVEGGSKDNTWQEIERIVAKYPEMRIKALRQTGNGKGNAVREGFAVASGEVVMILDADLTMPPEDLPKFYHAVATGECEFANGSRLVYPMETEAMRFFNLCANKAFSILFSWLLDQPVKDTLCGTKVMTRENYERIVANRAYFGDFDPFGDFDLLFGADKLNLKIVDIPIRYQNRVYGETNIQRWKHGVLLLRMVAFAARKLKFI